MREWITIRYATSYDGRVYLKECMAKFLTDTVFKTKVTSDNVIIVAGSGAVMDIMSTALMNPGEAFICRIQIDTLNSRYHSLLQFIQQQLQYS